MKKVYRMNFVENLLSFILVKSNFFGTTHRSRDMSEKPKNGTFHPPPRLYASSETRGLLGCLRSNLPEQVSGQKPLIAANAR